jgi:hypothetical protein
MIYLSTVDETEHNCGAVLNSLRLMDLTVDHWPDRRTTTTILQLADTVYRSCRKDCAAMYVDDIGSTCLDARGGIVQV